MHEILAYSITPLSRLQSNVTESSLRQLKYDKKVLVYRYASAYKSNVGNEFLKQISMLKSLVDSLQKLN